MADERNLAAASDGGSSSESRRPKRAEGQVQALDARVTALESETQ